MLSFGRRRFVSLISATSIAALAAVDAYAQTGRTYRIGVLETVSADRNRDNLDALLHGLRERGYVEGQNLRIEYRSADGRADQRNSVLIFAPLVSFASLRVSLNVITAHRAAIPAAESLCST